MSRLFRWPHALVYADQLLTPRRGARGKAWRKGKKVESDKQVLLRIARTLKPARRWSKREREAVADFSDFWRANPYEGIMANFFAVPNAKLRGPNPFDGPPFRGKAGAPEQLTLEDIAPILGWHLLFRKLLAEELKRPAKAVRDREVIRAWWCLLGGAEADYVKVFKAIRRKLRIETARIRGT